MIVILHRSATLSVDQRQRISIERAFLRDAPILTLNELTSALDAETERTVRASLRDLRKGKTTLVVSHHPQVLANADRVILLEKGRITAEGRYGELEKKRGYFRDLIDGREGLKGRPILISWGDCRDPGNDPNRNDWSQWYTPKENPHLCSWMKYLNCRNSRPWQGRSYYILEALGGRLCMYKHRSHSCNFSLHRRCIPLSMLKWPTSQVHRKTPQSALDRRLIRDPTEPGAP